jgi:hypothetical protein
VATKTRTETKNRTVFQGLLMLWRGMLPAVYRHAIYTGIRMSAYEEGELTLAALRVFRVFCMESPALVRTLARGYFTLSTSEVSTLHIWPQNV